MNYTKQQIINKCLDLEEENKAFWHITGCLEEDIIKLKQEIDKLNEEMRLLQERSSGNTEQ